MRGSSQQLIHAIGSGVDSEEILGPRGAGLARAKDLGLRTPAGFTLSISSHAEVDSFGSFSPTLQSQLAEGLSRLEHELKERLDSAERPLFLSVAGDRPRIARERMLVGLSERTLPGLEALVGPGTAASLWVSTLRRFAEEIRGIDPARVEAAAGAGAARRLLALIDETSGTPFPEAAADQLREAIVARWRQSPRGTAVTVHRSVLPIDARDLTDLGVAFTRNPATGANEMFGGLLAEGSPAQDSCSSSLQRALSRSAPQALEELTAALPLVEVAYKQICAVSFAVEAGQLTVVDVRPVRGSALATNKMLVDLVEDHVLQIGEAITLAPLSAASVPGRAMLAAEPSQVLGGGSGLGSGAVVAPIAVGEAGVRRLRGTGARPIMVVDEPGDADATTLSSCAGLLIACAAAEDDSLVAAARLLGVPVVAGVRRLAVAEILALVAFPGATLHEGEMIAIDGGSGMVATGAARELLAASSFEGSEILNWCRERAGVTVAPEVPPEWSVVASVAEFGEVDFQRPLLIDLAAAGRETQEELLRMIATVPEQLRLGLRPPPILRDTLRLPSGRWDLIIAETSPTIELLAAKLALLATASEY